MHRWMAGLLALGLFAGCSKERSPAPVRVADSPYHPFQVGWEWTYEGKAKGQTMTRRVLRHEKVGELPCAVVETKRDRDILLEHLHATPDGLFVAAINGRKVTPPLRLLKLPPRAGEQWETPIREGKSKRKGMYLLGEATVKVPAGTFATVALQGVVIEETGRATDFTYWFARDRGIVKMLLSAPGNQVVVYELKGFKKPDVGPP
ncbi:MAG: hypothetical protein L0Z62_25765 [Gemmataceae bacterium]|nr:hypothetical protein [Gemmataceae bacterium]